MTDLWLTIMYVLAVAGLVLLGAIFLGNIQMRCRYRSQKKETEYDVTDYTSTDDIPESSPFYGGQAYRLKRYPGTTALRLEKFDDNEETEE
jgi:hypothetical protein